RPFEWGADMIVHSSTKFLGGHGTSMGGVVVDSGRFDWAASGRFSSMTEPGPAYHGLRFYETFRDMAPIVHTKAVGLRDLGPTMSLTNAFLTLMAIESLPVRMQRHCENAQGVAEFLAADPRVSWVSYPGLKSSPYYALGKKYMPKGVGS